ncbi:hypothetical protein HU200_005689 [Digitaria exilis]|uniref:Uncoupling protein n=1 Tax=Digitaria exilis TaxID=1010633 RepID=A0A835KSG7_9POAL|nr:hypothetical protein HU200_005689 [Digitaria exilis]
MTVKKTIKKAANKCTRCVQSLNQPNFLLAGLLFLSSFFFPKKKECSARLPARVPRQSALASPLSSLSLCPALLRRTCGACLLRIAERSEREPWEGTTAPRSTSPSPAASPPSAIATCFAEICTIPLDTAKVRLQLQKNVAAGDALPKYRGLLGTAATIAREEGAAALWKGIVPGLHRQCIYGGLRIGLYEPVKSFYVGKDHVGDVPLSKKIAAGFTTGAIAIAIANPTDLVKVRLQAEGKLAPGVPRRYAGAMDAYAKIARQEGVARLWTGLGPNIARNGIINAAELASYDHVKQTILKLPGFKDDVFTHLVAGLGAGFFAVCVGSPVDVVKSRMMGDCSLQKHSRLFCEDTKE